MRKYRANVYVVLRSDVVIMHRVLNGDDMCNLNGSGELLRKIFRDDRQRHLVILALSLFCT